MSTNNSTSVHNPVYNFFLHPLSGKDSTLAKVIKLVTSVAVLISTIGSVHLGVFVYGQIVDRHHYTMETKPLFSGTDTRIACAAADIRPPIVQDKPKRITEFQIACFSNWAEEFSRTKSLLQYLQTYPEDKKYFDSYVRKSLKASCEMCELFAPERLEEHNKLIAEILQIIGPETTDTPKITAAVADRPPTVFPLPGISFLTSEDEEKLAEKGITTSGMGITRDGKGEMIHIPAQYSYTIQHPNRMPDVTDLDVYDENKLIVHIHTREIA